MEQGINIILILTSLTFKIYSTDPKPNTNLKSNTILALAFKTLRLEMYGRTFYLNCFVVIMLCYVNVYRDHW